jgi:transcriptional regulator with XRE-family HTH domain
VSSGAKMLGEVVRELREHQGLNQAQLAERAQLAMSYITLLESGQPLNLSPSALGRLARALGVTAKHLTELAPNRLGGSEEETVVPGPGPQTGARVENTVIG